MKTIEVKEIDKFQSTVFKNKTITEYIIYYLEDNVRKAAFTEIGESAKDTRIKKIMETFFIEMLG
jgi:hypothetical protein